MASLVSRARVARLVAVVTLMLIVGVGVGRMHAQTPQTPQTPPAAAAPAAPAPIDPMKFTDSSVVLVILVTADGAPQFESLLTRVKDALAKSDKPEKKAQAAHWKVIKVNQAQGGNFQYMCVIDQVAKDQTYDPFRILGETGTPADEVRQLYDRIGPTIKGVSPIPMTMLMDMGGGS